MENLTNDDPTDVDAKHKCAYELCKCRISLMDDYCSDYCSDADDLAEETIQCDCKHDACALD